jgi:hypothetical protein
VLRAEHLRQPRLVLAIEQVFRYRNEVGDTHWGFLVEPENLLEARLRRRVARDEILAPVDETIGRDRRGDTCLTRGASPRPSSPDERVDRLGIPAGCTAANGPWFDHQFSGKSGRANANYLILLGYVGVLACGQ